VYNQVFGMERRKRNMEIGMAIEGEMAIGMEREITIRREEDEK